MIFSKSSPNQHSSPSLQNNHLQNDSSCFDFLLKDSHPKSLPKLNNQPKKEIALKCKIHKDRKLSIYDIDSDQLCCDLCLMFNPEKKQLVLSDKLIDASEIQKMNFQVQEQIDKICFPQENKQKMIENFEQVERKKIEVVSRCVEEIEAEYNSVLQQAKVAREQALREVFKDGEWFVSMFQNSNEVIDFKQFARNQRKSSELPIRERMEKLSQAKKLQKQCFNKMNDVVQKLEALKEKQYFVFPAQRSEQEENIDLDLSLSEVDHREIFSSSQFQDDEMLLEGIEVQEESQQCRQISSNLKASSYKFEEQTEMSESRSIASCMELLSQSQFSQKPNSSVMEIQGVAELQKRKINSNVKELRASGLGINAIESKKLFKYLKESFVRRVDLSFNKLNSNFVLNLSRREAGKYLKQIKLAGNCIDFNSSNILKKLKNLQKEGIKIIF